MYSLSDNDFLDAWHNAASIKDFKEKIQYKHTGSSSSNDLKSRCSKLGIPYPNPIWMKSVKEKKWKPDTSISNWYRFYDKRIRIPKKIREDIFRRHGRKCRVCGKGESYVKIPMPDGSFVERKTKLQIDHVDGNPLNNTIGNPQPICGTCHTATPEYSVSNRYKKKEHKSTNTSTNNSLMALFK